MTRRPLFRRARGWRLARTHPKVMAATRACAPAACTARPKAPRSFRRRPSAAAGGFPGDRAAGISRAGAGASASEEPEVSSGNSALRRQEAAAERANGRLAMLGISGVLVNEVLTGKGLLASLGAYVRREQRRPSVAIKARVGLFLKRHVLEKQ